MRRRRRKEVVSNGSKLFHLDGEYSGDLAGQEGQLGQVMIRIYWVNLGLETKGLVGLTAEEPTWVELNGVDFRLFGLWDY